MENIVIIGAGPAGISAALYAARGNLNPLVKITVSEHWKRRRRSRIIMVWNSQFRAGSFMREDLLRQKPWVSVS